MKLKILLVFVAVLAGSGCARKQALQAVVGATLLDGTSHPPVADSVVLIEGVRLKAMGTKAEVPLPAGTVIFQAPGRYIFPLDPASPMVVGGSADFIITGVNPAVEAEYVSKSFGRMKEGRWVEYPH